MKTHIASFALAGCLFFTLAAASAPDDTAESLGKWREDLDYLYQEIEGSSSLREIFKVKGIDWKKLKQETDRRFKKMARAASKRKRSDDVVYYDVLQFLIGQLRDSHATIQVDESIREAWRAQQPKRIDAGIELQPGAGDVILVSNTFAARGANSPLHGRGVRHDGTILESVNGVPAGRYFEEKANEKFTEEGWLSSLARARVEALNDLHMAEDGRLELVFKALDMPEAARRSYVELSPKKRARAFKKLTWKTKKVSIRATECAQARNPRNFFFMHLERPKLNETADSRVGYTRLESGVGYIRYSAVSGQSRQGLDEACQALEDCQGIILDMRINSGGGESGIGAFDREDGSWQKPVAVLMGPKAISAAETEIWKLMRMRDSKRCIARFFGQTTAGSSGDKIRFELPSGFAKGRFVHRHWHGGRSKIEGAGIEPDEVVDQDVVELSLGIDSFIRAAEDWLLEAK